MPAYSSLFRLILTYTSQHVFQGSRLGGRGKRGSSWERAYLGGRGSGQAGLLVGGALTLRGGVMGAGNRQTFFTMRVEINDI